MILKKKDKVPDSITGGLGTVAIRMPSHPVAKRAYKKLRVYIAAQVPIHQESQVQQGQSM